MNQIKRCYLSFCLLIFHYTITLIAQPISSFSLKSINDDKDPNFNANFTLLGDAQIVNVGNFVNLTSPLSKDSFGQIVYKKPFKFIDPKSSNPISFSSEITFTMTQGNGDGMAFVIFPKNEGLSKVFGQQGYFGISNDVDLKFFGVEFDTRKDDNVGDLNGNHVGVDVSSFVSVEISDVSSVGLLLNGGVPLTSWVDYEGSSKRVEIRLAESGTERPYNPLISYPVDLSKMWVDEDLLVGISSSSGNSSQITSLSSWSFEVRTAPSSLNSEPLDPETKFDGYQNVRRKKSCFLTVLGGVIFATGCGTLLAFLGLFVWVILFGRHSNVVPELPMNPIDFKYEKVDVTVDNVGDENETSTRLSTS